MSDRPFLTIPQLARRLGVSTGSVYELTRRVGPTSIPRYRLGRRLVFDFTEVIAWVKTTRDQRTRGLRVRNRRERARRDSTRVPAKSARRLPDAPSGGRQAQRPTQARGLSDGHAAGALQVPETDA